MGGKPDRMIDSFSRMKIACVFSLNILRGARILFETKAFLNEVHSESACRFLNPLYHPKNRISDFAGRKKYYKIPFLGRKKPFEMFCNSYSWAFQQKPQYVQLIFKIFKFHIPRQLRQLRHSEPFFVKRCKMSKVALIKARTLQQRRKQMKRLRQQLPFTDEVRCVILSIFRTFVYGRIFERCTVNNLQTNQFKI